MTKYYCHLQVQFALVCLALMKFITSVHHFIISFNWDRLLIPLQFHQPLCLAVPTACSNDDLAFLLSFTKRPFGPVCQLCPHCICLQYNDPAPQTAIAHWQVYRKFHSNWIPLIYSCFMFFFLTTIESKMASLKPGIWMALCCIWFSLSVTMCGMIEHLFLPDLMKFATM